MSKTPVILGASLGAISSGLIVSAKLFSWPHPDILIPAMPAMVGLAASILHFCADYLQLDNKTERQLKKRLKTIESGLKSQHTSDHAKENLKKQYDQTYYALLNVSAVKIKEANSK